jgi:hypothetical protein
MADLGHWVGKTNPAYQAHSDTSRAAATQIKREKCAQLRRAILQYVRRMGADGATDHDLYRAFPAYPCETVRVRRIELCQRRALVDSCRRRPSPAGRASVAWILGSGDPDAPGPDYTTLESQTLRLVGRLDALAVRWRRRKCGYAASFLVSVARRIEDTVAHETARAHEHQA